MEGKPDTEQEPQPVDAVLCVRRIAANGEITVEARLVGDMRATEVDTVLTLARRRWRAEKGLE